MRNLLLCLTVLLLPPVSGCGNGAVSELSYRPFDYQGTVDVKLPRDLQWRQATVSEALNGIRIGLAPEAIAGVAGIQFRESSTQFFEGEKRLARWSFSGRPTANGVPVVLYLSSTSFSEGADPKDQRKVERVYSVALVNGKATVTRR
jgi:hypothetical protein